MQFIQKDVLSIDFKPFEEIEGWALLTAGTIEKFNIMTATGFLCGKFFLHPMIQVYVHPDRYSHRFFEESDTFTVSFFEEPRNFALRKAGSTSGASVDKVKEAGLTVVDINGVPVFEEAKIVFVCKKAYHHEVARENFDSPELFDEYYKTDPGVYHTIYMGTVEHVYVKAVDDEPMQAADSPSVQ